MCAVTVAKTSLITCKFKARSLASVQSGNSKWIAIDSRNFESFLCNLSIRTHGIKQWNINNWNNRFAQHLLPQLEDKWLSIAVNLFSFCSIFTWIRNEKHTETGSSLPAPFTDKSLCVAWSILAKFVETIDCEKVLIYDKWIFNWFLFTFSVCGQPAVPSNAKVKTSQSTNGQVEATYECDSGYELFGPKTTKCDPIKGWEKDVPFCGEWTNERTKDKWVSFPSRLLMPRQKQAQITESN